MASYGRIIMTSIIKFTSESELFSWAADDFIARATHALENKNYFDVALSGGSTAQNYFGVLAHALRGLSFLPKLRFFVSDERYVELSSTDSNAGNAWLKLLKPLGIAKNQLFSPYDTKYTPEQAGVNYENLLRELLHEDLPVFDIIYLGIGQDGHIASLFPQGSLVKNSGADPRLVAAPIEEIAQRRRLSFMPKLINAAEHICVMAPGISKAQVLDEIMMGPLDPLKLPAQLILRTNNPKLTLLRST